MGADKYEILVETATVRNYLFAMRESRNLLRKKRSKLFKLKLKRDRYGTFSTYHIIEW